MVKAVGTTVQADFSQCTNGKGVDKDGDGKSDQFSQTVCTSS